MLWNHEFKDRRVDTSASYAGGTPFLTPGMSIGADSVNLGGGATYAFAATRASASPTTTKDVGLCQQRRQGDGTLGVSEQRGFGQTRCAGPTTVRNDSKL